MFHAVELGPPVVGFEMIEYTVIEGMAVPVCVEVLSGASSEGFSLQMLSVFAGTASGNTIHMYLQYNVNEFNVNS